MAVQAVVYFVAVAFDMAYVCFSSSIALAFDMRSIAIRDVLVAFDMRIPAVDDVLSAFGMVKALDRSVSYAFSMSVLHEWRDLVSSFWPCRAVEAVVVFICQAVFPDL